MERNNVDLNDDEAGSAARRKLYLAALNGDWKSVEDMPDIQRRITTIGETALHIAAAANQEDFVKNLLNRLSRENLAAENNVGNTALHYATAAGNVKIAKLMLEKRSDLPNLGSEEKPLFMAASLGHSQMAQFLYNKTKGIVCGWNQTEQAKLFITCVGGELYGIAMEILMINRNIATARNMEGKTALQLLARNPSAFVSKSRSWLKFKQENSKQASELFKKCLQEYRGDDAVIQNVLFDAAEEGNIECLIMLIRFEFDLLWKTKGGKSIFHVAAEKRHESIFCLFNEISSVGGIILNRNIENIGNILHLVAELPHEEKLNAISGAALQMQLEMLWFKEVEKIVPPVFKEAKNERMETPYAVFAKAHEKLRTKGEKWMIGTANYSMVVATIIGSIMFSGQIADGLDDSSEHYFVYSVASAISLFSSSTSIVMFLSILTSRFSYNDFVFWLPLRLLIGVATLCISIAAMMVAFLTSFMLKNLNRKELPVIYVVIGLFSCAPIFFGLLKWYLLVDIVRSTFFRFKPRQRLLYKEVSSREPASPASESSTHCINLACIK